MMINKKTITIIAVALSLVIGIILIRNAGDNNIASDNGPCWHMGTARSWP